MVIYSPASKIGAVAGSNDDIVVAQIADGAHPGLNLPRKELVESKPAARARVIFLYMERGVFYKVIEAGGGIRCVEEAAVVGGKLPQPAAERLILIQPVAGAAAGEIVKILQVLIHAPYCGNIREHAGNQCIECLDIRHFGYGGLLYGSLQGCRKIFSIVENGFQFIDDYKPRGHRSFV